MKVRKRKDERADLRESWREGGIEKWSWMGREREGRIKIYIVRSGERERE